MSWNKLRNIGFERQVNKERTSHLKGKCTKGLPKNDCNENKHDETTTDNMKKSEIAEKLGFLQAKQEPNKKSKRGQGKHKPQTKQRKG